MSKTSQPRQQHQQQQQQGPPFPNNYILRQVSLADSKPCMICFKPSSTVLVSENQHDFFYVCPSHLLDDQFATPIKPESYNLLHQEVKQINQSVAKLRKDMETEKPYLWGMSNYWKLNNNGDNPSTNDNDNDKDKDNDKEKSKSQEQNNDKDGKSKYETLKARLADQLQNLKEKEEEIKLFKFKKYQLEQTIYKNRLMLHQRRKHEKEKSEKLQQEGFFPQAPTHQLTN